jgi:hypothetical protein
LGRTLARSESPARVRSPPAREASPEREGSLERSAPGARSPGALGGLGLTLRTASSDSRFQDFGFAQRRLRATQLRDQRSARPLIKRAAALSGGTGVQSGDGAGD